MINIENRLKHWSTGWTAKNQGDSPAVPFELFINYFLDKNTLEIGPGEGRQYEAVKNLVDGYAIADISENVLDCPKYQDMDRFLIRSYHSDFKDRFDLIHFWYVLHHVPSVEVQDFFDFVDRHLKKDSILMFNTPFLGFDEGAYGDDGVNTTPYTSTEIDKLLASKYLRLYIDSHLIGKSNGVIFVWRKK